MGILGPRALDIPLSDRDLCLVLGYLASPGRVGLIEAQIPSDRVRDFTFAYPGQAYYEIKQGYTTGGNLMKQGCQFRIYFNNTRNCPNVLRQYLGAGNSSYVRRINKGAFIEKIIEQYGFRFGESQNVTVIRNAVRRQHPSYITEFDRGYNL